MLQEWFEKLLLTFRCFFSAVKTCPSVYIVSLSRPQPVLRIRELKTKLLLISQH